MRRRTSVSNRCGKRGWLRAIRCSMMGVESWVLRTDCSAQILPVAKGIEFHSTCHYLLDLARRDEAIPVSKN